MVRQDAGDSLRHSPVTQTLFALAGSVLLSQFIWHFYWPAANFLDVSGHAIGRDFINVWAGAQMAFGGRLELLFDHTAYHAAIGELFGQPIVWHAWSYPLYVLPLYWPFAQLPYPVALTAWTVVFGGLFLFIATRPIAPERRFLAAILIVLSPAALINTIGGQNGFLTGALVLTGMLFAQRRPVVAGLAIGCLAIKPHLAIVLPFVLMAIGAWRAFATATLTVLSLAIGSVAVLGVEPWQDYFRITGALQFSLLEVFQGFYTSMMVSVTTGARSVGIDYPMALAIQSIVAASILLATVVGVRRTEDPMLRTILVVTAAPLITPYAFNYDLVAVAAGIIWLLFKRISATDWRLIILLAAWTGPVLVMFPFLRIALVPQLALIALFWVAFQEASEASRERKQQRDSVLARI